MANRIDPNFSRLKRTRRKALIGYVTAGFPTKASLQVLVPLLEQSGADLLELGVPFSDPIADGPTIQYSSQWLSEWSESPLGLDSVKHMRKRGVRLPLILMSYCNPIHAMGVDHFFQTAAACGVDGLIIPDMIPEEADVYARSGKKHNVHLIYLAAPDDAQIAHPIDRASNAGFSLCGILDRCDRRAESGAVRRWTFLKISEIVQREPVAVGFGITTPEQARTIASYADGVIVGSELIRQIESLKSPR